MPEDRDPLSQLSPSTMLRCRSASQLFRLSKLPRRLGAWLCGILRISHKATIVTGLLRGAASTQVHNERVTFYAKFIQRGDLCFDIGANIGNRTDMFLALGARVVCVEPQPNCASMLAEKYRKNSQVLLVPKGVAAQPGIMPLSLCESASTIATFSEKWETGRFRDYRWESTVDVSVTTLDALIQEYGVPAFCKIDVEGFERQVLQGLSSPIPALSFEFTKEFLDDANACMNYLATIQPVVFNYTLGEIPTLALSEWSDASTITSRLHQIQDRLLWGDIYAKFLSVKREQ